VPVFVFFCPAPGTTPARQLLYAPDRVNLMREHLYPSSDVTHTTLSVLFIALLTAGTFWILRPFVTSILWAGIISVAAWPLVLRLESALGRRRGLAVAIITTTFLLLVFVPVTLALGAIVNNARNISGQIRLIQSIALPAMPAWLEHVPIVGTRLTSEWREFAALGPEQRAAALAPYLQTSLRWFAAQAGGVGAMLLQFLLTTIIAAILLTNGETVRGGILSFASRLAGRQGAEVATLAARAVRSVVLGIVGTALIQTAIGGTGLLIAGVPGTALIAAVMLFLCLAQLGPVLVLAPVVIWLYWSANTGSATVLLVLTIIAGTIDNVIRPVLIRRGANLPLVLVFAGVIGGLIAFGMIGVFIGPVVLAVTYTLLKAWVGSAEAIAVN
jgi:predicted PurR-regulated permease PerM